MAAHAAQSRLPGGLRPGDPRRARRRPAERRRRGRTNVLVEERQIAELAARRSRRRRAPASSRPPAARALPGFVDLHAHFRVPGREDEEDLATATAAAAAGGYVAVFGMANTDPVVDTAAVLHGLARHAPAPRPSCPVGFYAAVTRGLAGRAAHRDGRARRGRRGRLQRRRPFRRDGAAVRRALQYVEGHRALRRDPRRGRLALCNGGQMHEGPASARIGLSGMPSALREPRRRPRPRARRLRGRAAAHLPRQHRRRARAHRAGQGRRRRGHRRGHAAPSLPDRRSRHLARHATSR